MRWVFKIASLSFAVVAVGLLASCGSGDGGASNVNQPPVAADDITRADGTALDAIDVVANDHDTDGDALSVAIETNAPVGTASVNADNTVKITGLPSGFKGVTRFTYRITDPAGQSAVANAVIFVGTDPFRAVFAGDAAGNGSPEVYLSDFATDPQPVTVATEGTLRLRGFVASDDGSTVVYRREDSNAPAITDLSFVRTNGASEQVRIEFPDGAMPVQDAQGKDQYVVSPDGLWIAAVAGSGGVDALYLLNVSSPTTLTRVSPDAAVHVSQPRFSQGSALYFLATAAPGGSNNILYTVTPSNPSATAQVSAPVALGTDDIIAYSVAGDQSRILLQANRNGRVGLYFVDPALLQSEFQVSHTLLPGNTILESTVGVPADQGGSARGDRVAYTALSSQTFSVYEADVSATPNPHVVATSGARVIGFRPDDAAILYSRAGQVFESMLDGTGAQLIGAGAFGWYDSTGNIVVLKQFLPSGGTPPSYTALAVSVRGSFGTTQQLGTPVLATHYVGVSGVAHGVVIIGEGPTTGSAPSSARLALVNALAPDELLYLADFESPLNLTSEIAQVVSD